ncbi:MAG TPA: prolyl-tRNA synthetase associated domain-containing protein [Duganella sp.]|nr:prolyl-tRNA synthetase associated domain-containing protein [Duganella sp.]
MESSLIHWLDQTGTAYHLEEHPPVYTIDEALAAAPSMPGLMTKNIFARDGGGKRHFLIIVPFNKRIDLAELARVLPSTKLGMASPERLMKHLGIVPGSVSILALINDSEGAVEVVIDTAVWGAPAVQAHPLRNTATVSMTHGTLERFLKHTGHVARVLDVPGQLNA